MAQFDATWTQIADTFKDYPQELVFEPLNEVGFEGISGVDEDHRLMAELNSSFHEIVRSSGGNNADRLLVLETIYIRSDQVHLDALAAEIEALDDPMLAASTHDYAYWPFSVNVAGTTTYSTGARELLEKDFKSQVDTFVARGIPVIIGEYGLLDNDDNKVERGEYLISFADPAVEDASGTNESLLIPTEFNGDPLATMESMYDDGTGAGFHDWTTFPEFWDDFRPDYEDGTIELTKRYLDSLEDGEQVSLTFHFWSGETLEYTVTRDGTVVTGTAWP